MDIDSLGLVDNHPANIEAISRDLGATEFRPAGLLFLVKQLSIIPAAIDPVRPAPR